MLPEEFLDPTMTSKSEENTLLPSNSSPTLDPEYLNCSPDGYREPFWPSFAHPTWLSCDQLYHS